MTDPCLDNRSWQLLTVIVDCSAGSRVLKIARQNGISGGTIVIGRGTYQASGNIWDEDLEVRKELVLMIADQKTIDRAMDQISRILRLDKPNRGIAFILSIMDLMGSTACRLDSQLQQQERVNTMEKAIFVIVDRGSAELVVEAAESAGARGATLINARGAGVHETSRLFSMDIEPEKEIVLILAEEAVSGPIMEAVSRSVHLDEPGKGILFAVDVQKSFGLR